MTGKTEVTPLRPDTGDQDTETLISRYCSRFGEAVCRAIFEQSIQSNGLRRLVKLLEIRCLDVREAQLAAISNWLEENGSRGLFRLLASRKNLDDYQLRPVPTALPTAHDKRLIDLLIKTQKPPTAPPSAPLEKPTSLLTAIPIRSSKPRSEPGGTPTSSIPIPTSPGSHPFPGYPFPWPKHLRPGPVAPPPDVPPEKLTWPHVDRRRNPDRRRTSDRRARVDLISRNKRFGGDRRRFDRRRK